jgi:flagellar biosynthetic protein FliR
MTIPVFEGRNMIVLVKAGLALSITFILIQIIKVNDVACFNSPLSLGIGALREILLGIAIGLSVRFLFAGVQCAGHLIGYQMGFAIANTIDPLTSSQTSIIAQFKNLLAMLVFLTVNAHHWFLKAMVESFRLVNPFAGSVDKTVLEVMIRMSSAMFIISVKVAAPIMVALLFTNVALGLVAKAVPQMNVFIVSFPVTIGVGLLFLMLTLPYLTEFLKQLFEGVGGNMLPLLEAMGK